MNHQPDLAANLDRRAAELGHRLGWAHLYCPADRCATARLATIGLNPGGGRDRSIEWADRRQLDDPLGNSYLVQNWGRNGGKSVLQGQIARLFQVAEVSDPEVVSLNAVPFRSPDWRSLPAKPESIEFGLQLLVSTLSPADLRVVVGFGLGGIEAIIAQRLGFEPIDPVPTGWGKVSARRYRSSRGCTMFGLPHLSRFAVLGRPEARELENAIRDAMLRGARKPLNLAAVEALGAPVHEGIDPPQSD